MRLAALVFFLAGPVLAISAQAQEGAPLSAIDWLIRNAHTPATATPDPGRSEPETAQSADVPQVTVAPLDGPAPRRVGLVPGSVTGLPDTLWSGTDGTRSAAALTSLPVPRLPAAQSLLYTLLLAEAVPPGTGDTALVLARIDTLLRLGALEPALALTRQAGPRTSDALFARFADTTLLTGDESQACAMLRGPKPPRAPYALQIFCAARASDWDTATLLLGTARTLGELPQAQAELLARFLDPDLFEGDPPLPPPARPDPLAARMMEAIGTPISTSAWPRVYANLDLRDLAGWKAQLEAAERLAETGALDANRLLGLITARRPAASGGIWERTRAIQQFDTALRTGSADAVTKTLRAALNAARQARMSVPFADLFANRLLEMNAPDDPDAYALVLLSSAYEQAPTRFPDQARAAPLAAALAIGDTAPILALENPQHDALRRAFAPGATPDNVLLDRARQGALGPAILSALRQLDRGARGDFPSLTRALATLRALGLEDMSRRAALQVLLLEASE